MEKKKLALFDMDQTLLESDSAWAEAFVILAREIGEEKPESYYDLYFEEGFEYLIDRVIEKDSSYDVRGVFGFLIKHVEHSYRHDVELKEGAVSLVAKMKEAGYLTAILTANNPKVSDVAKERFMDVLGIDHWYSVQEWGLSKGNSSVYDYLSELHGIDKEGFVLFDDASYAVETAHAAGIKVVKVYNPRDSKEREGFPYPLLDSLTEFDISMIQ